MPHYAMESEAPRPQSGASRARSGEPKASKGDIVYIVPLDPVCKTGLAGHVPVTEIGQGCRRKSYSGYPSLSLNYKNVLAIEKTVL